MELYEISHGVRNVVAGLKLPLTHKIGPSRFLVGGTEGRLGKT